MENEKPFPLELKELSVISSNHSNLDLFKGVFLNFFFQFVQDFEFSSVSTAAAL